MRKYTIGNKKARKELEDAFHIRKLLKDSFRKTNNETKPDFSKSVLRQINNEERNEFSFNPLIIVAFAFVVSVLIISGVVIYLLSM